ncbi:hypothetical protein HZC30_04350 [Candidatus Woesearchaeota archaeon]|nr:hypothetical protein [Candidatus Woesearchaeota archaeon]
MTIKYLIGLAAIVAGCAASQSATQDEPVLRERYTLSSCTFEKNQKLKECDFEQRGGNGSCKFNHFYAEREVNLDMFDKYQGEPSCEFVSPVDPFKPFDPEHCTAEVAEEYAKRMQEVEAAYTYCLEGVKVKFTNCTAEAEVIYQRCSAGESTFTAE